MVCPPGRVKASDQPLIAAAPVFAMVRLSVRPVLHALVVSVTRHEVPAGGGLELGGPELGGLEPGGPEVGGLDVCPPPVMPKKLIAAAAMPLAGRLCPAPWMLYAST